MLRHGCGYALANAGHDTRALQAWLGHKNIQHMVRYTELAPDRFNNFWRPLRLPTPLGLSLAGLRLVIADRALGSPVLRALSLCTCCRHYPGAAAGRTLSLIHPQPCQPSPKGLSGRPAPRPFRGLLGVHSRYGLHTRAVTNA